MALCSSMLLRRNEVPRAEPQRARAKRARPLLHTMRGGGLRHPLHQGAGGSDDNLHCFSKFSINHIYSALFFAGPKENKGWNLISSKLVSWKLGSDERLWLRLCLAVHVKCHRRPLFMYIMHTSGEENAKEKYDHMKCCGFGFAKTHYFGRFSYYCQFKNKSDR